MSRNRWSPSADGEGLYGSGWRKVHPGGRVRFNSDWFRSDALIPHVGERLLVIFHGLLQVNVVKPDAFRGRVQMGTPVITADIEGQAAVRRVR